MEKSESRYLIYDHNINYNLKYRMTDVAVRLLEKVYKARLNRSHPQSSKKKYEVSICAIFKNEAKYLREWVIFHQIIGIDHFYLYNNNSDDEYEKVLKPFVDQGIVDLIQFPYDHAQMKAYQDCIKNYKNESSWIGFIDLDEFIVPIKFDNIKDFLKQFDNRPSVLLYWQLFGSSGLLDRDSDTLVTESFKCCWPKHDIIGKCFYNTKYDVDFGVPENSSLHHTFWGNYKGRNYPPVNFCDRPCIGTHHHVDTGDFPIQINHYFTKSFQEYVEKTAKGDVYFVENPHNLDYFYKHENKCTSYDVSIFKYLIKLKREMQE